MQTTVANCRGGIWLCLVLLLAVSGCSVLPTTTDERPIEPPQLPPKPVITPPVETSPEPVAAPEPAPAPAPVAPPEPPLVTVLLTSRIPDYEGVAIALRDELGYIEIYDLADRSLTPREIFDAIRNSDTEVVVAVGHRAAGLAAGFADLPVVYAQVFNTGTLELDTDRMKGVAMLPPLDEQLAAWKELNPNLSSVGAILGPGHDALLAEAASASDKHGIRFESREARSDRETLYLFTRLVPEVDGFWLFPDNRILSADVLRQMLTYAARHRVQVAVFNDSLLSLGATLSATAVDSDIARTILAVANRLLAEEGASVPAVSPLSEIEVSAHEALAHSGSAAATAEDGR